VQVQCRMEEGDADAHPCPLLVQWRSVVVTGSKGTHAAVPVNGAFPASSFCSFRKSFKARGQDIKTL
jgi:hypothetical protein